MKVIRALHYTQVYQLSYFLRGKQGIQSKTTTTKKNQKKTKQNKTIMYLECMDIQHTMEVIRDFCREMTKENETVTLVLLEVH